MNRFRKGDTAYHRGEKFTVITSKLTKSNDEALEVVGQFGETIKVAAKYFQTKDEVDGDE